MNQQNYKAPNSAQECTAAAQLPSERLYQFAAVTAVIFLLATMI